MIQLSTHQSFHFFFSCGRHADDRNLARIPGERRGSDSKALGRNDHRSSLDRLDLRRESYPPDEKKPLGPGSLDLFMKGKPVIWWNHNMESAANQSESRDFVSMFPYDFLPSIMDVGTLRGPLAARTAKSYPEIPGAHALPVGLHFHHDITNVY